MSSSTTATAATTSSSAGTTKSILLEDFQNPINEWSTLNDPVMGGQSYSDFEIDTDAGVAKFTGECAIVPSLQAPGFITMETGNQLSASPSKFPDISSCTAFQFQIKTNTPYKGYRFSFGKAHAKGGRFAAGYKVPLRLDQDLPPVGEFGTVVVPFTNFSNKWDDATGDILVECSSQNPMYCPSEQWLQRMETMSFWGEGVEGLVDLEVQSIHAIGCDITASEKALRPSIMLSKMHTITSNPFYLGAAIALSVLGCMVAICCYGCFCHRRCCRRRYYKTMQTADHQSTTTLTTTTGIGTYKDDPNFDNEGPFHDGNDIELS